MSHHLNYTMAGILAVGGLAGYAKKRSAPSLVAGLSLGAAYAYAGYLISQNEAEQGHLVGTATSGLVLLAMGPRFVKSRKIMPAGILTITSLVGLGYNGMKYNEWRQ